MTHKNPELDHQIERAMDNWEEVKQEVETKIILGRLELDHLKLIDGVEEQFVAISNKSDRYNGQVQNACEEAEQLRSRIRRRLLKQGTATEIPYRTILSQQ